jgi:hypothetical protein
VRSLIALARCRSCGVAVMPFRLAFNFFAGSSNHWGVSVTTYNMLPSSLTSQLSAAWLPVMAVSLAFGARQGRSPMRNAAHVFCSTSRWSAGQRQPGLRQPQEGGNS